MDWSLNPKTVMHDDISPQRLTIYLYSAHRAVIFAIAQLSCYLRKLTFRNRTSSRPIPENFLSQTVSCDDVGQSESKQWRNDGVAAASRDGGPPLARGPPTVPSS